MNSVTPCFRPFKPIFKSYGKQEQGLNKVPGNGTSKDDPVTLSRKIDEIVTGPLLISKKFVR